MHSIKDKIFPINTVSLEGPDLSGKTTLYNNIHRSTGFCWDIRDRSSLSRVCFSRQYGRDVDFERGRLKRELSFVNNKMIVVLPSFKTLSSRFEKRGDEIQSMESLKALHGIYEDEVFKIHSLPNVLVLRPSDLTEKTDLSNSAIEFLTNSEGDSASHAGAVIRDFVKNSEENEQSISARFFCKKGGYCDHDIFKDEKEGSYYKEIYWDFENIIRKEMRGLNPYNKPQTLESRRFYYNSDSCISSIHFMPRGNILKCFATFRSTDVEKNAQIDLEFLNTIVHMLANKYFFMCDKYEINVHLNSAHIVEKC